MRGLFEAFSREVSDWKLYLPYKKHSLDILRWQKHGGSVSFVLVPFSARKEEALGWLLTKDSEEASSASFYLQGPFLEVTSILEEEPKPYDEFPPLKKDTFLGETIFLGALFLVVASGVAFVRRWAFQVKDRQLFAKVATSLTPEQAFYRELRLLSRQLSLQGEKEEGFQKKVKKHLKELQEMLCRFFIRKFQYNPYRHSQRGLIRFLARRLDSHTAQFWKSLLDEIEKLQQREKITIQDFQQTLDWSCERIEKTRKTKKKEKKK